MIKKIETIFLSLSLVGSSYGATSASAVINYAKTAAGSSYKMGGSRWDPKDRSFGATDCAGLVLKAWRWPKEIGYKETLVDSYTINGKRVPGKLYTGSMFEIKRHKLPWSISKDYDNAKMADAYTYNDGERGHTLLVTGYDTNKNIKSLEARSRKHGVGYFSRTKAHLKSVGYSLMRNSNVSSQQIAPQHPSDSQESPVRIPTQYQPVFHSVVKGDTLSGLSKKYRVPMQHIISLNPSRISSNFMIRIGEKLQVK